MSVAKQKMLSRWDLVILTSRNFDQLGSTIHLESRHIQNFDLEEYEAL
ncbi:hypothetical protein M513_08568 [Trichuris suis]|uniref:Uncharacterized protein n=1 Tax=Trichuris suis TaxID=68888 RepID=A0A085LZV4_9BILA|nr:hypothetical protein M513_08568 [Trichuris suis]